MPYILTPEASGSQRNDRSRSPRSRSRSPSRRDRTPRRRSRSGQGASRASSTHSTSGDGLSNFISPLPEHDDPTLVVHIADVVKRYYNLFADTDGSFVPAPQTQGDREDELRQALDKLARMAMESADFAKYRHRLRPLESEEISDIYKWAREEMHAAEDPAMRQPGDLPELFSTSELGEFEGET